MGTILDIYGVIAQHRSVLSELLEFVVKQIFHFGNCFYILWSCSHLCNIFELFFWNFNKQQFMNIPQILSLHFSFIFLCHIICFFNILIFLFSHNESYSSLLFIMLMESFCFKNWIYLHEIKFCPNLGYLINELKLYKAILRDIQR